MPISIYTKVKANVMDVHIMAEILEIHPDNPEEQEPGTARMRQADARLSIIEDHAEARHGGDGESINREVDRSLKDLVNQTKEAWLDGKLSAEEAQDMILVALGKIDEYKDDDDPATNGEIIATALSGLPNELLGGALHEFLLAEGKGDTVKVLAEIQGNNPNTIAA